MSDAGVDGVYGPVWAIVLAAGQARRFGPRSKQFELIGGRRMIDLTVSTARAACDHVVLVLPAGHGWDGPPVDVLVAGGDHRAESLRAGLAALPEDAGVAVIADPAHPLAPQALFTSVIEAVRGGADGAVPVVAIHDVVQRVRDGRVVGTLPKDDLVITQSPQAYRVSVLRAVHADAPRPVEDSSLLVERGYRVDTVAGEFANLHVTTPHELAVLDLVATGQAAVACVGE